MFKKITLTNVLEWGTYLLVFLLPWQTRLIYKFGQLNGGYWEYGSNSLYATEIILWLLAVLFFVYFFKNRPSIKNKISAVLVFLLIIWLLISLLWSLDRNLSVYYGTILIEGLLLYFLVSLGPAKKIRLMISFILAAAVQALLAWQQFLWQLVLPSKWLGLSGQLADNLGTFVVETSSGRWLRVYGSLPHPNVLGAFLVVALIFIFSLSLMANSRSKRLFLTFSLLLILPALFFTFSRGAWLALAICYLLFAIWLIVKNPKGIPLGEKNIFFVKLSLSGLVIIVIMAVIFWQPFLTRVNGVERLEVRSTEERLGSYHQALSVIKPNWYKGVGLGNYTLKIFKDLNNTDPAYTYQPVHNIYLLILAEWGIVGLIIFLAWCFYLLLVSHGSLAGKLCLVSFLVIGLFDHFLWSLYFGIILWWLVAGLTEEKYVS